MFKDILLKLAEGGVAVSLLAADLGISLDQLHERLRMMEHMGYIASDVACTPGEPSPLCACCSGCRCSSQELPMRFLLTEKGRRLIRS
jgi:hypothetical protein